MSDRDEERRARAERLVGDAVSGGRVELPTLTREELAALGTLDAGPWRDADDLTWWSELPGETRRAVTVAALRGLGARGLVDLCRPPVGTDGPVQLPAEPELATVLVARARPAFVVLGGEPEAGQLGRLRLYGVVEEGAGLRCLLSELVEEYGLHRFALCSPRRGLADLAGWACTPAAQDDQAGRPRPSMRTLELIEPRAEGPRETRLIVLVGTDGAAVAEVGADDRPGEPAVTTADQLAERLERLLAGARRPVA
jgi:hypothetical protein